jgi:alpha-beta hydrolase superfamily lysophospholipase
MVLFGNCWGAKAASVVASRGYRPVGARALPDLSGLILTCPALFTKVDLTFREKLIIGRDVIFGGNDRRQLDIPIKVEMFTDNAEFIEFIKKDPLRLTSATTRFYFENFLLTLRAARAAKHLQLPLLLVQTNNDQIVDCERVQKWFQKVRSHHKTMHVFPNASHSIDFDTDWFSAYIKLITNWLSRLQVSP